MVILVDFENVNSIGLVGLKNLNKDDTLYLFYNDTSKINLDTHRSIENSEADKKYQKVTSKTPNAADFLIVTVLGVLIGKNSEQKYFIISKDTGFDVVVKYLKSNGVDIFRCDSIKDAFEQAQKTEKENTVEPEKNGITPLDCVALPPNVDKIFVLQCINKYKTKMGLNNALVKKYGNDSASVVYKAIKPLIKDKKGN